MRIKDVMSTVVEQVSPGDSVEVAKARLQVRGVNQLVVVDGRAVKGIVTATQLTDARNVGKRTVADVMTRHLAAASPDLPVRKAANLLRGSAVGALPVLERGRLVGIVTVSDLLEWIGRGGARPVDKGTRWTLRNRGVVPAQARAKR